MPSLHCGWALWVAWVVTSSSANRKLKVAAVTYALGTAVVVVVTGNHWVLDVIVGWAVAVVGIVLAATPFGRLVDDRINATVLGRGANRAGSLLVRGFQEMSASLSWTLVTPIAASTFSSPAAPGASPRTVQEPGAAKNLKSPVSLENHLGGELAAGVQQPHVRRGHRRAVPHDLTLDHGLLRRVHPCRGTRALHRGTTHGPDLFRFRFVGTSQAVFSIGTPTSEPYSVQDPS